MERHCSIPHYSGISTTSWKELATIGVLLNLYNYITQWWMLFSMTIYDKRKNFTITIQHVLLMPYDLHILSSITSDIMKCSECLSRELLSFQQFSWDSILSAWMNSGANRGNLTSVMHQKVKSPRTLWRKNGLTGGKMPRFSRPLRRKHHRLTGLWWFTAHKSRLHDKKKTIWEQLKLELTQSLKCINNLNKSIKKYNKKNT